MNFIEKLVDRVTQKDNLRQDYKLIWGFIFDNVLTWKDSVEQSYKVAWKKSKKWFYEVTRTILNDVIIQ